MKRPSCDPLSAPDNGMIDCSLGGDGVPTSNDRCRFSCNDGFELSGSQSRRCRIRNNRGSWSGNPATCNMGMHLYVLLLVLLLLPIYKNIQLTLKLVKFSLPPSTQEL